MLAFLPLAILISMTEPVPACAVPNAPASVVSSFPPETPYRMMQPGANGDAIVYLMVSLDAKSQIQRVEVVASSNPLATASAVYATKRSQFQTQVVSCQSLPGAYIYVIEYESCGDLRRSNRRRPAPIDPAHYLSGTWSCRSDDGTVADEAFVIDAQVHTLSHTRGDATESFTQDSPTTWHVAGPNGIPEERGKSWVENWYFTSFAPQRPSHTMYVRVDEKRFRRAIDSTVENLVTYRLDSCNRTG